MTTQEASLYTALLTTFLVSSLNYWFSKRGKMTDRELLKQYELNEVMSHLLQVHQHLSRFQLMIELYKDDSFSIPLFPKSILFTRFTQTDELAAEADTIDDDDALETALEKLRRYHPTLFLELSPVSHQWTAIPRTTTQLFQQMPLDAAVQVLERLTERLLYTTLDAINIIEPELEKETHKRVRAYLAKKPDASEEKRRVISWLVGLFPPHFFESYNQLTPEAKQTVSQVLDGERMVKQLLNRSSLSEILQEVNERVSLLISNNVK